MNIDEHKRGIDIYNNENSSSIFFGDGYQRIGIQRYGDESDFSDKFSLDRWWFKRIEELPDEIRDTFPFLYVPKPTKEEKEQGCWKMEEEIVDNTFGNQGPAIRNGKHTKSRNVHPTCKPIALFTYLIALSPTHEGDIILDPFAGSGTTAIACKITNRKYIMIERDPKYFEIMKTHLGAFGTQKTFTDFFK
jgi:site-specific DNA-methyltransferase (adenine-specific)